MKLTHLLTLFLCLLFANACGAVSQKIDDGSDKMERSVSIFKDSEENAEEQEDDKDEEAQAAENRRRRREYQRQTTWADDLR